jgi:hypothetical protein
MIALKKHDFDSNMKSGPSSQCCVPLARALTISWLREVTEILVATKPAFTSVE